VTLVSETRRIRKPAWFARTALERGLAEGPLRELSLFKQFFQDRQVVSL